MEFDDWLINEASDKVDYALIHSSWVKSREEAAKDFIEIILSQKLCHDDEILLVRNVREKFGLVNHPIKESSAV